MKRFVCIASCLLLITVAAPVSASIYRGGEQPEQAEQSETLLHNLEKNADDYISTFMGMLQSIFGGSNDDPPAAATVAELAANAPGNMSMLINAVGRADLQTVIANPDFQATIFCPTNAAFREALVKLKLSIEDLYLKKDVLINILSYHVIHGQTLMSTDFKDGQDLETVNQKKLTVKVDKVHGVKVVGDGGAGGETQVIAADLKAGKSVIHVVDAVLLPPPPPSKQT